MRNQYFRLEFKEKISYLHFYPAEDGGEKLNIKEVTSYLDAKKLKGYELKALNDAIGQEEEVSVPVGDWDGYSVAAMMEVDVSLDKMTVYGRFYPPSAGGGREITVRDIVGGLIAKRVRFGIDPQAIFHFMQNPVYCTDVVLARGLKPRHGADAKIEYFFNTDKKLKPKHNEDGSVDYKELNTISHVKEGDLLARLTPEDRGDPGKNVYGEPIKPRNVKTAKLGFGKNIRANEDKTEIYSEVTGHATLTQGKVFVSNVFEVPADVDNSVGNINYDGNVTIHGNVKTGFTVEASGDIIIDGVVENAVIKAGGQLIVKSGIHGGGGGTLIGKGNVLSKFVENAKVKSGNCVETEIIMGSDVEAADAVRVKGKKGLISGGSVHAKNSIEAKTAGSTMGTATELEVGIEPEKRQRYIDLTKEIKERQQNLEDMKVIIAHYGDMVKKGQHVPKDKMDYAQKMAADFKTGTADLEPLMAEVKAIQTEMLESDQSYIIISDTAYPGVTISISDLQLNLKDTRSHTKFHKAEGEIKADIY